MGVRLLLMAPSAPPVAISSYIDILPDLQYVDMMNNSRFLKTIKAVNTTTGDLVVVKMLIKPASGGLELADIIDQLALEAKTLALYPNILPWHQLIETDRAGYCIRQLLRANLYDRLSMRPFLSSSEKLFLVFQMTKAVEAIHSCGVYHGDIKLENFAVTSWNWLFLTDFATYTKPAYIPEDNPNQYAFYYDSSGRRVCYLAPERFYNSKESKGPVGHIFADDGTYHGQKLLLTSKMDCFSLGCVIAELYADGEPLFTLSQLFSYMVGEFSPDLSAIDNEKVKDVVKRLISLDPNDRPSVAELLSQDLFPEYFDFLFKLMAELSDDDRFVVAEGNKHVSPSDLRISLVCERFADVAKELNFNYTSQTSQYPLNLNLPGMPENYRIQPGLGGDSAVILASFVFSHMKSLKQPESKVKACELILALSERVDDEIKLDRSLPYLFSLLDEYMDWVLEHNADDSRVACFALKAITALLALCRKINPVNVLIFPEYVIPKLQALLSVCGESVRITAASCLPHLARTAKQFWMVKPGEDFELLQADVATLAFGLLTDSNVDVRISLVNSIALLCEFFEMDRTNDVILPHLITFLNDSSFQLRLAFLSSIVAIEPFIGVLSFEQYLLPLLVQTLGDSEPLVVIKVLEVLSYFVGERMIHPKAFNTLAIYRELLSSSLGLLVHPNEWIRQSVLVLVLKINDNLLVADRYCFLYPKIKDYFAYDITVIDWNNVYPSLVRPVSRLVFEAALTWSTRALSRSLFWKKGLSKTPLAKLGRSVYVPKIDRVNAADANVPLSAEDKPWVLKLRSVGLGNLDLWKVYVLRDFIVQNKTESTEFPKDVNLLPRNIFFEVCFKTESITGKSKTIETESSSRTEAGPGSMLLMLPNFGRAKASLQTMQATVFGELELGHSLVSLSHHPEPTTNRVFSVNSERIISNNMSHSYSGHNPYILNYLQKVEFEPSVENFPEFGKTVKRSSEPDTPFQPTGTAVAHISNNSDGMDGVTVVAVCLTSEFFVTGSEKGFVKVWDTAKLERNITAKNSILSINLHSKVLDVCFMPNRLVLAVATANGVLRIFRIDVSRGKNRKIVKYNKLVSIREQKVLDEGEYFRKIEFMGKTLVGITSESRIVGVDIFKMESEFVLQNPLGFGTPTSFVVGHNMIWMLVGTSEGFLCLWDLRFLVLLKKWKLKLHNDEPDGKHAIKKMVMLSPSFSVDDKNSDMSYVAMIGGSKEPDVTVWEIPNFVCRQVYRSLAKSEKPVQYRVEEVDENSSIAGLFSELSIDLEQLNEKDDRSLTALSRCTRNGHDYIISSTCDRRVVVWDTGDYLQSSVLNHDSQFSANRVNSTLTVMHESSQNRKSDTIAHTDTIVDMDVVSKPFQMLVSVDRNGYINLYK